MLLGSMLPAVADSSPTTDSYGTNTLTVRTFYNVETGCRGSLGYQLDHMTFKFVREDSRWTAGFKDGAMGVLAVACSSGSSWQRSKTISGPSSLVSGNAYSRDFGTPSNFVTLAGGGGTMNAHVALNLYLSGGPQRGLCALAGPFEHQVTGVGCH
ncbi:MAG: hypothetical protein WAV00_23820 [Nocardioides sp.]